MFVWVCLSLGDAFVVFAVRCSCRCLHCLNGGGGERGRTERCEAGAATAASARTRRQLVDRVALELIPLVVVLQLHLQVLGVRIGPYELLDVNGHLVVGVLEEHVLVEHEYLTAVAYLHTHTHTRKHNI